MHRFIARIFTLSLFMALLAGGTAFAQVDPPQPPPQQAPDVEVNDAELKSIAKAYVLVQQLLGDFQQKFDQVDDPAAATEIQQEFAEAANTAIEDEGVEVDRYDLVIQAANADEELRDRLVAEITVLVEGQEGADQR